MQWRREITDKNLFILCRDLDVLQIRVSAAPTSDTILYDKFRVSSRADKLARFNLLFNSGTRVIHELHRAYYQKQYKE